jgi:hypothetical protein
MQLEAVEEELFCKEGRQRRSLRFEPAMGSHPGWLARGGGAGRDGSRQPPDQLAALDLQGDTIASWAKTLMADAFFWKDHDLGVQTRMMNDLAPRKAIGCFHLDYSADSSDFK